VFTQGGTGEPVFASGESGAAFLDVLADSMTAAAVEVHSFCLLADAYHLLVRTPRGNLPQAMRQLNGSYAHWCRRDGRRSGPVFDRRYRSVLLDPDGWPLRVSRYIHLLPVQRGMVSDPLQYRWSSLRALARRAEAPGWLEMGTLLRLAGGPEDYLGYVGYGVDAETKAFYARTRIKPVLGQPVIPDTDAGVPAPGTSIAQIVRVVAGAFGLPTERLYDARRGRGAQATPRAVVMLLARSPGGYSLEEIAEALNVRHRSTVSVTVRRCRERLQRDDDLRAQVGQISETL
jgi:REP element-mobilizing transposase RayT